MIDVAVAATFARGLTEEQFDARAHRRPRRPAAKAAQSRTDVRSVAARRGRGLRGLVRFAS